MVSLGQLQGVWRRSLIAWPSGARDTTTHVTWVQGPSFYGDLRQPANIVDFAGVHALRQLRLNQVEALAVQEGFAGLLIQHPDCFEWTRLIDYQPKPIYSDRGTLAMCGDVMIETGYEVPYVEHWHREQAGHPPATAVALRDRDSGRTGVIVRVGTVFMYCRSRAAALDETRHLLDYVRSAGALAEAQDLVDCEISLGVVGEQWRIQRSSLPYRVMQALDPRRDGSCFYTKDVAPDGTAIERAWTIVNEEGPFLGGL